MCRFKYGLLDIAIVVTSLSANAQTYTTGHEDKKADVNFTELAKYYQEHPLPLVRKAMFDEDDEEAERPEAPEPDPSMVHLIHRNASRATSVPLPASPAPTDTFVSTVTDGTAIPPDTHGEVDATHCVTAINTEIHMQNRTGGNISAVALGAFWSGILASPDSAFDPRVHYDPHYNRWIMVTDAYGQTSNSTILIAVSATGDPTGTWHRYSIIADSTGHSWLDFPCVGFNDKWITVTGNFFQNTSGTGAQGAVVYVFNYASIMAGTGAPYVKISESSEFTLCPALTYDTTQQSMFLLDVNNSGTGKLRLFKITGAVGSPVIATVGYPTTTQHWHNGGSADFVPQLGTTNKVQAGDDRITHVVYRNNHLWCSNTVFLPDPGTASRCSVMWWEIDTLANPIQNGLIDDPATPTFYDYSSIAVNKNDDALIGLGYLSANIYPSAAYALHMHTDPNDSMRPVHVFRHGKATYYQTFGGTQNRWGDYSCTSVDPVNSTDFWTIQESVPSVNNWDTWWAYVSVCPAMASYTKATDSTVKFAYDTLTFTGTGPTGTTYTWSFDGGTAVPGTGAGPQAVKWTTDGWKVITLTVSDSGCSSVFTDSVLVKSTVGVNEVALKDADINIVPNPNDGSFDILLSNPANQPVRVKVTDMQGRIVYSHQFDAITGSKIPVTTTNLVNGNYIVSISIGGNNIAKKITITR